MKYRHVMSRRTFLRGAGTVTIGLPVLDAMRTRSAFAALPEPPVRAFNLFFGLGYPTPLQTEGYDGPLAPLAPLRDKLVVVRGVDQVRCDVSGINAHFDGAAGAFTAERPNGDARAGGPSLDQVLRRHAYPNNLPSSVIPSLLMGTFFQRDRVARYAHSWNDDGSAADRVAEAPRELFERVFGEDPGMVDPGDDPVAARRQRLRRSVLDSVLDQYRHYQSDASNLGRGSRARIADHLQRIREHELRVFGDGEGPMTPTATCTSPDRPPASTLPHGSAADPSGEGIDITLPALVGEWRLMADLYALAIQCDRARFGSATFQASGERIRLTGRYEHEGRLVYDFDDRRDRGRGGALGCSHEYWHAFNASAENRQMRAHLHLMMRELGYLLRQLDDPDHRDDNGRTILENAMITISTESGDGRHNDVRRELSGVFHVLGSGNERFATGSVLDVGAEGIDLYNTMLGAYGVTRRMGPADRAVRMVSGILR